MATKKVTVIQSYSSIFICISYCLDYTYSINFMNYFSAALLEMYVQTRSEMESIAQMTELMRQADATVQLLERTTDTPLCTEN